MTPHRPSVAPRAAGSQPRRRSVEYPINARLVRGTWLLVALPLLLAAFTMARPQSLPPPALPPAFDAATAAHSARELARVYPDRSPGSPGSLAAAQWVVDQLKLYGFGAQVDRFTARVPGRGRVQLQNLAAVVPGPSPQAIVFTAHRDNTGEGRGTNDNASGTAALIELARAFAPVTGAPGTQARPAHTLVFLSTDGGAFGALGAARFAEHSPYRDNAVAVISLDAIAGAGRPRLLIGGDRPLSPAGTLVRTAAARILEESREEPVRSSAVEQLLDLGFPFALGEQGPFVARGIPAITLTTGGERPPDGFADPALDVARLGEVGRAAQNLLGSLDAGLELAQGTTTYIYFGRRIVRGWAIELVLLAALLPFLIATIDLFARCRRRRIELGPAVRALRRRLGFWAYAGALVLLAAKLGLFPDAEPRPLPTNLGGLETPSAPWLVVFGALLLCGWLVARERLLPRDPAEFEEMLAGYTVALLSLAVVALLVIATNPFALIYLLPSLYAWLWLPQVHATSSWARGLLLVAGLGGPLLLVVTFARRYALGWDAPWYLLSLLGVGYVPWIAAAVVLAWAAVAAQFAALVAGRYAAYPDRDARRSVGFVQAAVRRRRAPLDDRDVLEG
jgi:peptidase M28-like protein